LQKAQQKRKRSQKKAKKTGGKSMKQEKKSRGRRVQDILCFFCSFPYFDRKKALMREEIRKNDRSNKKKSKFVTKELLFALEKKTYTSMMAPPGALFLSFSRFLRAFFSTVFIMSLILYKQVS